MTPSELFIITCAASAAGFVNAIAGGGTLISFPVLLAMGVPPVAANVTNAVALCPGYFAATLARVRDLGDQGKRLWLYVPIAIAGGLTGGAILLRTRERTFETLIPYMLFFAALLLALQERVRAEVLRRLSNPSHARHAAVWAALPVLFAAIYGGFFSAGMGVIVLALLGATLDDTFTHLNALKQVLVFSINVSATVFFLFSDQILWLPATVMAVGALIGGTLGGRIVGKLKPAVLRWTVVFVGFALSIVYWIK